MKEKEIELKTFEKRVTNSKDQNYLKNYIYKYRYWQNILTILTINLFKANNNDYKHFLDYAVIRACVADTKGDKKKVEIIEYIKEKYKGNQLYQDLVSVGQELKTHNLVEIVKRLKKDFSNYFKALKDYQTNPSKYTGLPQLPKAKKLSQLTYYSIPLDNFNSISFKKKNVVRINLNSKIRYFYFGKTDEIDIFKKSEIKSVKVKIQNNQIYLQFTYKPIHSQLTILNSHPSEVIEFKESKTGTKYPIKWSKKGNYLKRFKTYLTQKRNEYFKNSFHKLSKKVIEYLQLHNVTHLVISSSLAELKNNGKKINRGLFKDTIINKIFNADLNGVINHIKLAINKSFQWLKNNLWKLTNPIKLKSAGELHNLLCNIHSNKSNLKERRTTARAYRYSTIY